MNQQPKINEQYWLNKNPEIIRSIPAKAYYGSLLIRVELDIMGASMRWNQHQVPKYLRIEGEPTYFDYLDFVKRQCIAFNHREIIRVTDNRNIYVKRVESTKYRNSGHRNIEQIFDARVLYNIHNLLQNRPTDVNISRQANVLRLYSNNEDAIIDVINRLGVDNKAIRLLGFPHEEQIEALLAGKEYNKRAPDFKFKVFIKPVPVTGIPALSDYLKGVADTNEVDVPTHCRLALEGTEARWTRAQYSRSYLYVRDENTMLIIKMLAGDKFSTFIELVPPVEGIDK